MSDPGPPELPPLPARAAAALTLWAVCVSLLYLAVRELGLTFVR